MRIAYICADPGVPVFGRKGCSVHVQEVIRAMIGHGAHVDLFATRVDGDVPSDLRHVPVHHLPALPKADLIAREIAALAANSDLRNALMDSGSFDLIYERYSLWSHAGMDYANDAGIPSVLEINAPLIQEQVAYRGLVHRARALAVAQSAFSRAGSLLAVSEEVASWVRTFGIPTSHIHVIPNGVNPLRIHPDVPPSLPPGPGTFTVGFVGTLKPWHGMPVLLDAFDRLHQQVPASRLLIIGDGVERERMVADVAARGIADAVHFTGSVKPDEVPGFLTSMDVAVAPYPHSTAFYFSPLKVYEYMAAGLPVVASNIGQLVDLIDDGRNGLLSPAGDAVALAQTLLHLYHDPARRSQLGHQARESVLHDRSWRAVVQKVFRLANISMLEEIAI